MVVAALVLLGALVAGPVPPLSPMAAPAPVRFTIVTANVRVDLGPVRARADVRRAALPGATSVVLLQEMWHRNAHRMAPVGWAAYQTRNPRPGCRGVAVLWDRRVWRAVGARGVSLDVSPFGAGCASVVVLRHRHTGLVVPVVDVHMVPGVELAGRPRPRPARVAAYADATRRAVELVAALRANRGRAIIGGDWNVDYRADRRVQWWGFPYARLHAELDTHWAKLPSTRPTHGRRRIDAVWWTEAGGFRPVDSDTLRGTWSDHNFVRLTLAAGSG